MLINPKRFIRKTPYIVHANSHALLDLQTTSGVMICCESIEILTNPYTD